MFDLLKVTYRFFTNSLSGTIIRDQFRVLCFELFKMFNQLVVFEVRDFGCGLDVVKPIMTPDFIPQQLYLVVN